MEIIKHGKSFRIATCPECECEFRFNKKEIKNRNGIDENFSYSYSYDYIECPECNHSIILEQEVIEI